MVSPVQNLKSSLSTRRAGWGEVVFVSAATLTVALLGSWVTRQAVSSEWYRDLDKPGLMPGPAVFGLVWTTLYGLMIVSYAKVRAQADRYDFDFQAIFAVNLLVNLAWSLVFFGQRSPLGGLLVIGSYLAIVFGMAGIFGRYSRAAAWLCVPLCAWVGFATYLNAAIVFLNR